MGALEFSLVCVVFIAIAVVKHLERRARQRNDITETKLPWWALVNRVSS